MSDKPANKQPEDRRWLALVLLLGIGHFTGIITIPGLPPAIVSVVNQGPMRLLIVRETLNAPPAIAHTLNGLRSGPHAKYLEEKKHTLLIIDVDTVTADGKPSPLVESVRPSIKDSKLPVLISVHPTTNKVLWTKVLHDGITTDEIIQIVKGHGG